MKTLLALFSAILMIELAYSTCEKGSKMFVGFRFGCEKESDCKNSHYDFLRTFVAVAHLRRYASERTPPPELPVVEYKEEMQYIFLEIGVSNASDFLPANLIYEAHEVCEETNESTPITFTCGKNTFELEKDTSSGGSGFIYWASCSQVIDTPCRLININVIKMDCWHSCQYYNKVENQRKVRLEVTDNKGVFHKSSYELKPQMDALGIAAQSLKTVGLRLQVPLDILPNDPYDYFPELWVAIEERCPHTAVMIRKDLICKMFNLDARRVGTNVEVGYRCRVKDESTCGQQYFQPMSLNCYHTCAYFEDIENKTKVATHLIFKDGSILSGKMSKPGKQPNSVPFHGELNMDRLWLEMELNAAEVGSLTRFPQRSMVYEAEVFCVESGVNKQIKYECPLGVGNNTVKPNGNFNTFTLCYKRHHISCGQQYFVFDQVHCEHDCEEFESTERVTEPWLHTMGMANFWAHEAGHNYSFPNIPFHGAIRSITIDMFFPKLSSPVYVDLVLEGHVICGEDGAIERYATLVCPASASLRKYEDYDEYIYYNCKEVNKAPCSKKTIESGEFLCETNCHGTQVSYNPKAIEVEATGVTYGQFEGDGDEFPRVSFEGEVTSLILTAAIESSGETDVVVESDFIYRTKILCDINGDRVLTHFLCPASAATAESGSATLHCHATTKLPCHQKTMKVTQFECNVNCDFLNEERSSTSYRIAIKTKEGLDFSSDFVEGTNIPDLHFQGNVEFVGIEHRYLLSEVEAENVSIGNMWLRVNVDCDHSHQTKRMLLFCGSDLNTVNSDESYFIVSHGCEIAVARDDDRSCGALTVESELVCRHDCGLWDSYVYRDLSAIAFSDDGNQFQTSIGQSSIPKFQFFGDLEEIHIEMTVEMMCKLLKSPDPVYPADDLVLKTTSSCVNRKRKSNYDLLCPGRDATVSELDRGLFRVNIKCYQQMKKTVTFELTHFNENTLKDLYVRVMFENHQSDWFKQEDLYGEDTRFWAEAGLATWSEKVLGVEVTTGKTNQKAGDVLLCSSGPSSKLVRRATLCKSAVIPAMNQVERDQGHQHGLSCAVNGSIEVVPDDEGCTRNWLPWSFERSSLITWMRENLCSLCRDARTIATE